MSDVKVITPKALALTLEGVDEDTAAAVAKSFVRPYLRKNFTRAKEAHGTNWNLTEAMVEELTTAWEARNAEDEDSEDDDSSDED